MSSLAMGLFLIFVAAAHEELISLKCTADMRELEVTPAPVGYQIELRTGDKIDKRFLLSQFSINDFFDPQHKQVFDVYTGENKEFYLQIKKPETRGEIKTTGAVFKAPPSATTPLKFGDCTIKTKGQKP